jgi:hypothetical protein
MNLARVTQWTLTPYGEKSRVHAKVAVCSFGWWLMAGADLF